MELKDCESHEDYVDYYEGLLDYLHENLPNLEDLISNYNESLKGE